MVFPHLLSGGAVYDLLDERGKSLSGLVLPSGVPGGPVAAGSSKGRGGRCVSVLFGAGAVDARRVRPGHLCWRSKDPALDSRLRCAEPPACYLAFYHTFFYSLSLLNAT